MTATITLPDGPGSPRVVQAARLLANRNGTMHKLRDKYGTAFTVRTFALGPVVMLADPAEVRQLFLAGTDDVDKSDVNLGSVLGAESFFAIRGDEHRRQRKLLTPPFHGRRLRAYESLMNEEAVREMRRWPRAREFAVMPSMMRITLNIILRAVFGADGAEQEELRGLLPKLVRVASMLAVAPIPRTKYGPWGYFWKMRKQYDVVVDRLIDQALREERDGTLEKREDILALLVQARYDDGERMSRGQIRDQLLGLLAAGHETTATTLAWAVERLRRHPEVLARLEANEPDLLDATIIETQRVRPVIEMTARQIQADTYELGRWVLPRGTVAAACIALLHDDPALFPNPSAFQPDRFVGAKPDTYGWIPFGGGVRRCIGAAFATMEMNVVLSALLRDYALVPTRAPGERRFNRGIAVAPARGGRAVVHRK
jgi:cytochrome P450